MPLTGTLSPVLYLYLYLYLYLPEDDVTHRSYHTRYMQAQASSIGTHDTIAIARAPR
jgi:hypothetical protein